MFRPISCICRWHSVGISMPSFLAASRMLAPFSTCTGIPSIVRLIMSMLVSPLSLHYRAELTLIHASAALDTFFLNDPVGIAYCTLNRLDRTAPGAQRTAFAPLPVQYGISGGRYICPRDRFHSHGQYIPPQKLPVWTVPDSARFVPVRTEPCP